VTADAPGDVADKRRASILQLLARNERPGVWEDGARSVMDYLILAPRDCSRIGNGVLHPMRPRA
jgi:hypothetical protein